MKRKGKKLAEGKMSFFMEFIRYFCAGGLFFLGIILSILALLGRAVTLRSSYLEKSIFRDIYLIFCIVGSLLLFYRFFFSFNDAIYENGLRLFLGRFWWFDRIRYIEVGEMVDEKNSKYRILVIHSEDTYPIILTELGYRNKDFFDKVLEECQKRCAKAVWIPMSLERKREIMNIAVNEFGVPVVKENFGSDKIGGPWDMYKPHNSL